MNVDLARWQFAVTTVYHFLFVPVTIGLSAFVAGFHTVYLRTRNPAHLRLSKFLGKLFTINFGLGLVTGIVQEFQFGMNWSDYSRFVGDIFGAPLAIEALLAFFLESTFLGLWIFGWGRIPEKLHVACIWIVHIGTLLSAYFILAANSFMQHPVGYRINPETGRAELTDFVAVLTNKVQMVTFPHTAFASYMCGAAVVLGACMWHIHKKHVADDLPMYRTGARVGAIALLVAGAGVAISGDFQGKVMTEVQPMKMAAAEALYETQDSAPFSILTVSSLNGEQEKVAITVPKLLSFLGTGSFDGTIHGINDLEAQYQAKYQQAELTSSPSYTPTLPLTYWSFRMMIGIGMSSCAVALLALWTLRRRNDAPARSRWWPWLVGFVAVAPVLGNAFGWIFTETGRQPWLVFGLFTTKSGVSPGVSTAEVATSLITFTLLYAVLAVIEVRLTLRYAKAGAEPLKDPPDTPSDSSSDDSQPLQFAY
ncbi:cytochrome ubiquinol oxidase subunit I [Luteipulveratus halotolerans]|uniref:Cytochrome BD ubiquinol oxidase subunit I n=1 Tax=Luteipulveratus halotolerans TaxID=1631356 RepID=A0A0L6CNE8_9MICO|nr:cytochrome ubiquinol oxidase subunit I [Luteipulveratus halotolerans]KNX39043.1 cytochrome BD ubiquinol oxidase subunit I [Luteipulveratus halotolerans]